MVKILSSHIHGNLLFRICSLDILQLESRLPLEFFERHGFIFWVRMMSTYCWHIHGIWSLRELPIVRIRHISFIYIYIYYVIKYRSSFSLIYICPRQAEKFPIDNQDQKGASFVKAETEKMFWPQIQNVWIIINRSYSRRLT